MSKITIEEVEKECGKIDYSVLDKMYHKSEPCNTWINQETDMVIINFKGVHGGIPVYASENRGFLMSFGDEGIMIIGLFFEGIVKDINPMKV